jgi:hypothetical protein
MALEEVPVGAVPVESTDEQQQQSPVDVAAGIRKDLEKYERAGGKQALREVMRKALRQGIRRSSDIHPVVDHLEQQGLVTNSHK